MSVSTLSNWQRGVNRPDRPDSRRVLGALEDILRVDGLGTLVEPEPRRHYPGPGMSRRRGNALRAELRLIGGHLVHLADFDLPPGFHGVRWE
ncbi:hypothetical protein [Longispora urticae]